MWRSITVLFTLGFSVVAPAWGQAAWQSSWDEFIKAYQACLNDRTCDLTQFGGKVMTWEGIYKGSRTVTISSGPVVVFDTEMTPGKMIDRNGTSVTISNTLTHNPDAAGIAAWQALSLGQKVRFQAQNFPSPFGAGFMPGLGFVVLLLDGSVVLPATSLPTMSPNGVVSGASFQPGIVPNSWFTVWGTNLSSTTNSWDKSIVNGNLPTTLDGVSVSVGGKPAYIYYVSPSQINALAPDVGTGSLSVTVTNSNGTSALSTVISQTIGPAFFLWVSKYAVATRQNFSWAVKSGTFQGVTTTPAKPGDVIILWGTGFGPTSPVAPVGVQVPADKTYSTANPVSVTVGGTPALVYGTALAPGFAGLYQVAIQIPTSAPDGDLPIIATVIGNPSPASTLITVQH
jgi:uncharacterized protein (TIGR03437 family)